MGRAAAAPRPRAAARGGLAAGGLLVLVAAFASPRTVAADPPEPEWAARIRAAIPEQDRDISRAGVKNLVNRLESQVARRQNDVDVALLYLLARAYGKAERLEDAVATYADVIKADAGCWFAWRDRGVLRVLRKDPGGAEGDLRHAVQLKPDYVEALQPLAQLLLETKRPQEAVPFLQRALDVNPANASARLQLVKALHGAKRYEDAMRSLDALLAAAPADVELRHWKARLTADLGDAPKALALFRQLAVENPSAPAPLHGWLDIAKQQPKVDRDEAVWVLDRLRRLVKSDEERRKLGELIEKWRAPPPNPGAPPGMPTPEQLAAALRSPDAARRREVIEKFLLNPPPGAPPFAGDLVAALMERMVPANEPEAGTRRAALAAFERLEKPPETTTGQMFSSVVRAALRDPDADVRAKAADVLAALGSASAIPALVALAAGKDAVLAAAARGAVYRLANARPPEAEAAHDAEVAAFQAWWAAPERASLKLRVVEEVLSAKDTFPERMLFPLAIHEEQAEVWVAAVRGLAKAAERAKAANAHDEWMRGFPSFPESDLVAEKRDVVRDALATWFLKAPGP